MKYFPKNGLFACAACLLLTSAWSQQDIDGGPYKDMFHKYHTGRVENADGEPLEEVKVSLEDYFGYDVVTVAGGKYTFDPVPAMITQYSKHPFAFRKSGYAPCDTMLFIYDNPTIILKRSPEIWVQIWSDEQKRTPLYNAYADAAFPGGVRRTSSDSSGYLRIVLPGSLTRDKKLRITFGMTGRASVPRDLSIADWLDHTIDIVLPSVQLLVPGADTNGEPAATGFVTFESRLQSLARARKNLAANPGDKTLLNAFLSQFEQMDKVHLAPADRKSWQEERPYYLQIKDYLKNATGKGSPCEVAMTRREQELDAYNRQHQWAGKAANYAENNTRLDVLFATGLQLIDYDLESAQNCQDKRYMTQTLKDIAIVDSLLKGEQKNLQTMFEAKKIEQDYFEKRLRMIAGQFDLLALRGARFQEIERKH